MSLLEICLSLLLDLLSLSSILRILWEAGLVRAEPKPWPRRSRLLLEVALNSATASPPGCSAWTALEAETSAPAVSAAFPFRRFRIP